jgi:hypothetical protein
VAVVVVVVVIVVIVIVIITSCHVVGKLAYCVEDSNDLGCEAVLLGEWFSRFQSVMLHYCSRVYSPFSLLFGHLDVKATLFFETSGATRKTQSHISDDLNSR